LNKWNVENKSLFNKQETMISSEQSPLRVVGEESEEKLSESGVYPNLPSINNDQELHSIGSLQK